MEIAMNILLLLSGVAIFLYGMKKLGEGLEKSTNSGIKTLFKKINKNRVVDYAIGMGVTAIIQSSSATSVIAVGLTNAGVVNLKQGSGIVLGAKVGTTVTAFIFCLYEINKGYFNLSIILASLTFVGVLITFITNNERINNIALLLIGFGLIFLGLEIMGSAIGGKDSKLSIELSKLFVYDIMTNPILLLLIGCIFTCIIQSSSAASGVFILFLINGVIGSLDQALFLMMGANIGTCIDAWLASFGCNPNGKRVAIFHVITSAMGAITFSIILFIFKTPIISMFNNWFPTNPAISLAIYNLSYNLIYTLIILIIFNKVVNLISKVYKDKPTEEQNLSFINDKLLANPSFAIEQALNETYNMGLIAKDNLTRSFNALLDNDMSQSKLIASEEYKIDHITKSLANFFIRISSLTIIRKDEKIIGSLHHVINDIERIGDHAVLFAKETNYMNQNDITFIDITKEELRSIYSKITQLFDLGYETFKTRKTTDLKQISEIHQNIIDEVSLVRDNHIQRLRNNEYSLEVSKSLYATLLSLHRIADHIINVTFSVLSDTGSKTEAFAILKKLEKELE